MGEVQVLMTSLMKPPRAFHAFFSLQRRTPLDKVSGEIELSIELHMSPAEQLHLFCAASDPATPTPHSVPAEDAGVKHQQHTAELSVPAHDLEENDEKMQAAAGTPGVIASPMGGRRKRSRKSEVDRMMQRKNNSAQRKSKLMEVARALVRSG
jgi:hypothetical protein